MWNSLRTQLSGMAHDAACYHVTLLPSIAIAIEQAAHVYLVLDRGGPRPQTSRVFFATRVSQAGDGVRWPLVGSLSRHRQASAHWEQLNCHRKTSKHPKGHPLCRHSPDVIGSHAVGWLLPHGFWNPQVLQVPQVP